MHTLTPNVHTLKGTTRRSGTFRKCLSSAGPTSTPNPILTAVAATAKSLAGISRPARAQRPEERGPLLCERRIEFDERLSGNQCFGLWLGVGVHASCRRPYAHPRAVRPGRRLEGHTARPRHRPAQIPSRPKLAQAPQARWYRLRAPWVGGDRVNTADGLQVARKREVRLTCLTPC